MTNAEPLFLLRSPSAHRLVIRYDSQLGHRYVPDLTARIPNELGGYYVRTNADGFRSDVPFVHERGERPRIVFLGDSVTAGDGVSNEQRFSDLVGDALGAEIYNYGLSGSGTDQQLLVYERFARDVEADLVVFCVLVENIERIQVTHRETVLGSGGERVLVPKPYFSLDNDGDLVLHHDPVPLERPVASVDSLDVVPDTHHGSQRLLRRLRHLGRSERLAWLTDRLGGVGDRTLRMLDYQPYPDYTDPTSPGWRLMEAILTRFVESARPTPVMIVPVPSEHFYRSSPLRPYYQERFETLADSERDVHVADLTAPLRALPEADQDRLRFVHDWHPSPFGNQVFADTLVEEIRRRELLPGAPAVPIAASPLPSPPTVVRPTHVLGISCFYHDSAAALITDGRIVACAQEERFSRIKNDRSFPQRAVNYCLEEAGIDQDDVTAVVFYDNTFRTFERLVHTHLHLGVDGDDSWCRVLPSWLEYKLRVPEVIRRNLHFEGTVLHDEHHRSHAASAFLPSPFDEAAILTIDGVGEWATASIAVGRGKEIEVLQEQRFPHSLGLLYSAFTQFTGFKVNEGEYKLMGLAPYGEPIYANMIRDHLLEIGDDGSVELDLDYFAFLRESSMYNERFEALFDGPGRAPDEPIGRRDMDIARSIQEVTEDVVMRMARHAHELTGQKNLCTAGGVALNCVANGKILRDGPFEQLWIQPAAGDSGGALGAALDAWCTHFGGDRVRGDNGAAAQGSSCWGPGYSESEIIGFLETYGLPYEKMEADQRSSTVAALLEEGMVVGHFSGRLEFGPRALGSRSIIGDARDPDTQTKLNLKIKQRESFRPFAPAVLEERARDYFDLDAESPYMLIVAPVLERCRRPYDPEPGEPILEMVKRPRSEIPAVTHVDYSARIQTVRADDRPAFHDVIREFDDRTGCGLVVNTSFNVNGEPIVCTPEDAYRCFMSTDMDILVLGDVLLSKADQPTRSLLPDRPTPEPTDPAAPYDAELLEELRRVFTTTFLPIVDQLRADGVEVDRWDSGDATTMWRAYSAPTDLFVIGDALHQFAGDPQQVSRELLRHWRTGEVSDALEPVVRELMRVRRDHLPLPELGANITATVPGSAYVMY